MLRRPVDSALRAGVVVVHEPGQVGDSFLLAGEDRHLQGVEDQLGPHGGGGLPAQDAAGERVDHERHIHGAGPGGHVGEVRHPQLVRPQRGEVSVDQVGGPVGLLVGDGGAARLTSTDAGDAQLAHQPLDRAAGHLDAFTAQHDPHLPRTEDPVVGLPHPQDLALELLIPQPPLRRRPVPGGVVGGRGDHTAVLCEHAADRLDPEHLPVLVDEPHENLCGRSSSAAKKADADFKISFARRSSAFSRFNRLISACSSLDRPGRSPASISAWRTHLRSVSVDPMPSFCATAAIAAHCDG
jgi:hypothetical protein